MPFKDNGRAVLIGESTAGSTGQPYMLELGHELLVFIGAKREMFPDGSRFEGVGVKPDIDVSPSPDSIREGRDIVMETARRTIVAP